MPLYFILIPVLLPFITGAVLLIFPNIGHRARNTAILLESLVNLALVLLAVLKGPEGELLIFRLLEGLNIAFRVDGAGRFFAVMVSVLWPLTLLYAFEYMEHEERQGKFFGFFMMTLGAVLGIAFSSDIFTMYIFYEFLTLCTFPLVMHEMTDAALKAGRQYLTYMLGGASFAFVGIIVLLMNGSDLTFRLGGGVVPGTVSRGVLVFVFFMMFCGFSVKAAMMPFGKWLIGAAVAPMPVTALLHAVAVVKAGSFAVIRLIYYVYGTELIRGTWAQYAAIACCVFTILYGSTMAVKEPHLKRRMAYSTISNLSYILFGACIMTPMGMYAALMHTAAHAVTKIALFLSVGAIMHVTGKCYIYEIDNLGKRMKGIFICLIFGALSIIGVPQFMGFNSKISLLRASIDGGEAADYVGAFAIIISALLTAVYLLNILIRGYFPKDNAKCDKFEECHDPGWRMMFPVGLASAATLVLGIWWQPLSSYLKTVSGLL
jgi:multicomponent Na+:H+ antiporter subunit D